MESDHDVAIVEGCSLGLAGLDFLVCLLVIVSVDVGATSPDHLFEGSIFWVEESALGLGISHHDL